MLSRNRFALASASVLALGLAACGGGTTIGSIASVAPPTPTPTPKPTPAPTPTPTPTPEPPPPPPLAPAHLGLVSDKPFAVAAAGDTYSVSSNGQTRSVSGPAFQDVQFSYDASSDSYTITVPGFQTGKLVNTSYNGSSGQPATSSFSQVSAGASATQQALGVTLQVPGTQYSPYTYTTYGFWNAQTGTSSTGDVTHEEGIFAYGIPTAASGIPVTGNATYSAEVVGRTPDGYYIGGDATLQFAFADGTLSGHFDPSYYDWDAAISLGRYDFSNTVYSAGSTNFSGDLSQPGVGSGSFNGQFTGPNAEELMARWIASYNDPRSGTTTMMGGIWMGKKQ